MVKGFIYFHWNIFIIIIIHPFFGSLHPPLTIFQNVKKLKLYATTTSSRIFFYWILPLCSTRNLFPAGNGKLSVWISPGKCWRYFTISLLVHIITCNVEKKQQQSFTSSSGKLEVIDWGKLVGTGWYAGKYHYSSWIIWNLSFQRAYQWQVVSSPRTQSGLWRIPRTRYYEEGPGDRGAQPPVWRSDPSTPQHCLLTGRCSWPGTEQRLLLTFSITLQELSLPWPGNSWSVVKLFSWTFLPPSCLCGGSSCCGAGILWRESAPGSEHQCRLSWSRPGGEISPQRRSLWTPASPAHTSGSDGRHSPVWTWRTSSGRSGHSLAPPGQSSGSSHSQLWAEL